jgi:hypothetical protein
MVDSEDVKEGLSWADIWELRRARERGSGRPPPKERETEGGHSYEEVSDEIRLVIADTARLLAEDPSSGIGALGAAQDVASLRDDNRLRARRQVPVGEIAVGFAGWLIRRADRGDFSAAVRAAWLAANGSREQPVLGQELSEYVRGYLDGSISGEENNRRQNHPRAKLTKAAAASTVTGDPVASAAAAALSEMLGEVSTAPDALAAWEVFKRFAEVQFEPEPPERLDEGLGDLLLFEWGVFDRPWSDASQEVFLVDLVRQFTVIAENGQHERTEQVHCSISFDPVPDVRHLGSGTIWSDEDLAAWSAEAELSNGFVAIRAAISAVVHVEHERL